MTGRLKLIVLNDPHERIGKSSSFRNVTENHLFTSPKGERVLEFQNGYPHKSTFKSTLSKYFPMVPMVKEDPKYMFSLTRMKSTVQQDENL